MRTHSALLRARLGILEGYVQRRTVRSCAQSASAISTRYTHAHARTHARLCTRTCTHVRAHARARTPTISLRSSYPFFGVACAAQALQLWRLRIALPFALANWRNWLSVSCALIEHAQVGARAPGSACALIEHFQGCAHLCAWGACVFVRACVRARVTWASKR